VSISTAEPVSSTARSSRVLPANGTYFGLVRCCSAIIGQPQTKMDLKVGTRVRFIGRHAPPGMEPDAVGIVVSIEPSTTSWQPRVRVRFENYLSGWMWSHLLARESEFP
jgi:hypothetical protein